MAYTRSETRRLSTQEVVDLLIVQCPAKAPNTKQRALFSQRRLILFVLFLLVSVISGAVLCSCDNNSNATSGPQYSSSVITLSPIQGSGIDTSSLNQGYVGASAYSSSRLRFQVVCEAKSYNYNLPNDGTPTAFPLNMGNGTYTFNILQNTSGDRYFITQSVTRTISLASDTLPFIRPNIFCNYNESSLAVQKAKELMTGVKNEGDVVRNVYTWIDDNISYDKEKAMSVESGYIPNPDETLSKGKGICFDYASLAAAMLRSQGIPCKVMTGYITPEGIYHAWNMVYIDGSWKTVAISVSPDSWSRIDITLSDNIGSEKLGNNVTYIDRYTY